MKKKQVLPKKIFIKMQQHYKLNIRTELTVPAKKINVVYYKDLTRQDCKDISY